MIEVISIAGGKGNMYVKSLNAIHLNAVELVFMWGRKTDERVLKKWGRDTCSVYKQQARNMVVL